MNSVSPDSVPVPVSTNLPTVPPGLPHDSYLFLDCVRYHCVGLTEGEVLEARKLAAEGGAICEPDLVPRVTHILVGAEATPEALSSIREHVIEWREHVRTVKPCWFREAVAARFCVEPGPTSSYTLPQLVSRTMLAQVSSSVACFLVVVVVPIRQNRKGWC